MTQHLARWASPELSPVPALMYSPGSPASPISPIAPIARQPSERRTPSSRRVSSKGELPGSDIALGRQIGQGSFSTTFKGTLGANVYAVKVRLSSTSVALFAHEQHVLTKLSAGTRAGDSSEPAAGPGVVRFYGELSKQDFSVFDLYDTNLELLVREPRFQVDPTSLDYFDFRVMSQPVVGLPNFVRWARQLKSGVEFLHSHGVIHTDIKPDNVLFQRQQNAVVLADFSGAIDLDEQPGSILPTELVSGLAAGLASAPVFTDPAVRHQQCLPSQRSDKYALGLVFAFMATGAEPYATAKNPTQRIVWMDKIKPLDSFDPDLLPRLSKVRKVIGLCLERSFDGVDEALDELAGQCS